MIGITLFKFNRIYINRVIESNMSIYIFSKTYVFSILFKMSPNYNT